MSRNFLKELRRYACAGNKERVREILRTMLAQEPNDFFARAELQRLNAGKALYSSLELKDYKRIVDESVGESLRLLRMRYTDDGGKALENEKIRELLKTLVLLESRLLEDSEYRPELRAYRRELKAVLGKRSLRVGRKILVRGAVVLAGLAVMAAGYYHLYSRAEAAGKAMESAIDAEDWQRVVSLKAATDSGINKLLYKPMSGIMTRAEAWMAHKRAIHREAAQLMQELKDGKYSIENMPLAKRALMERYLRALPAALNDLSPTWDAYCKQAEQILAQQIPQVLEQIQAPVPPLPALVGKDADATEAELFRRTLQTRLREQTDAVDAYRLDTALLDPIRERLNQAQALEKEISQWKKTRQAIAQAKTYSEFMDAAKGIGAAVHYPPAVALAQKLPQFPTEQALRYRMQDPGNKYTPELFAAMERNLLEGGGTFCKEGPASQEQVELLNDLLTTRALRTKLYRITALNGEVAYSPTPYTVENSMRIRFKRAELDPAFRIGTNPQLSWPSRGVEQRLIDPTGLEQAAGLDRHTFFAIGNLPKAATAVLRYQHPDCPALAKAYAYDVLLRVMQMHGQPALIGAEFSPSLLEDARSFIQLRQTAGIHLNAGCWLPPTTRAKEMEATFATWFAERRKHDYAAEIASNFAKIARVHPSYIGYANENGEPVFTHPLPKGAALWYMVKDGLENRFSDGSGALPDAIPYSPLFHCARDKKKK